MRQAVMTSPGVIEFREVAAPAAGPGEVLLKVRRIGICGSDVHVWHGRHPFTSYPVVQGHEFSATVEAVGAGVSGIPAGAKATATPQLVCGECGSCRTGDYHICDELKVQGFQAPGVAQELFPTAADRVVILPDGFSFDQGALVEPAAVAVRATSRAGDLAGKNVAVVGAGPIGNLVAQCAKARRARVLVRDVSDHRLDVARRCGLEHVSNAREEGLSEASARVFDGGFRVAFECAGAEAATEQVVGSIGKGGTLVVVALYGERPRIEMSLVCEHELSLVGTLMYRRPDYEQAVRWMAEGRIVTEPLDSRHFPFEAYADAYRFIGDQGEKSMKVFIDL